MDLYLGLQGAFCAQRFVASRASSKKEGAPYRHFGTHSTKVVLTSSKNDEANSLAVWSKCQIPCNYIPKRSNPLLQAREVLRLLAEEGIEEGSGKEAEPRGDGD